MLFKSVLQYISFALILLYNINGIYKFTQITQIFLIDVHIDKTAWYKDPHAQLSTHAHFTVLV